MKKGERRAKAARRAPWLLDLGRVAAIGRKAAWLLAAGLGAVMVLAPLMALVAPEFAP